jgi:hypothetical protein
MAVATREGPGEGDSNPLLAGSDSVGDSGTAHSYRFAGDARLRSALTKSTTFRVFLRTM